MLRVSKNLLDPSFDGGSVRDMTDGRFTSDGAKLLSTNIRSAMNVGKPEGIKTNKISQVSSDIAKSLGENTKDIQDIIENQGDETKKELASLMTKMAAAQQKTGKASVAAIKDLIKQVERIRSAAGDQGDELVEKFGLDKAQKTLASDVGRGSVGGTAWRKMMKTDEGLGFKDSFKQAFTMEKMFGLKPSADDVIKKQREDVEAERENINQSNGMLNTVEQLGITTESDTPSTIEKNAEGGNTFVSGIDRESLDNKKVELLEEILAELKKMSDNSSGGFGFPPLLPGSTNLRGGVPRSTRPPTNTRPSRFSRIKSALGFADDVPVNPASVKPTLKPGFKLNSAGAPYNASNGQIVSPKNAFTNVADDVARAGTNVADDAVRGTSIASKVLGGTGRFLSRAAIPLTVGMGAYDAYTGYKDADQLVESGAMNKETGQAFTEQDETAGKVEAVTSATGGTAGAIAAGGVGASYGATAGAAIGSLFFGVGAAPGAAIGAVLGGAIGGTLGFFGGSAAGEAIGDAATTTSGEAALDAAIESGLYDKDWVGDSEIDPEILKQTTDTAQLNAILADEDLSEKDTNRVIERLSQLDSGEASTTVSSSGQNLVLNQADESRFGVTEKPPVNQTSAEIMPNSQEAQVSVTPTADAVANMTDAAGSVTTNNITNIYNTTNNNTSGGGGGSQQPILVNPSSSRENSNSLSQFKSNGTR